MRFSHTFTRGGALVCALALPPVWALAGAPVALAASGAAGSSGTGENTPLDLKSTAAHHAASSGGSGILRTIIALVIVIAIIYAVARILKAVKGGGTTRATGEGLSQLATLPLGPNRSVALVRAGADIVLVGVAESGVTPIKTYTEEEAIATGLLVPDQGDEPQRRRDLSFEGFLETVRRMTVRA